MNTLIALLTGGKTRAFVVGDEIKRELVRKSLHLLIALVPTIASWNVAFTVSLLAVGVLFYTYCEMSRLRGFEITMISKITELASRRRDAGRFVMGPVTLALGTMLSLFLYPSPAAYIAIYALAFGDGLSSLVGKLFGSIRIPFTGGKSLEGSLACFVAVLIPAYQITFNLSGSLIIAFSAMAFEALPSKDMDNIILPVATGFIARFFV